MSMYILNAHCEAPIGIYNPFKYSTYLKFLHSKWVDDKSCKTSNPRYKFDSQYKGS